MVAVRCISRAPSPASLASQLPQLCMGPVGASLLAIVAGRCIRRAPSPASLASQLAQWCMGPVGASLLAMVAVRCISRAPSPASLASQLPQWCMGPVGASSHKADHFFNTRVRNPLRRAVPHPPGTPAGCRQTAAPSTTAMSAPSYDRSAANPRPSRMDAWPVTAPDGRHQ